MNLYQQLSVQKTLYSSLLIYCLNKMVLRASLTGAE